MRDLPMGRKKKGSAFWIQTMVNYCAEDELFYNILPCDPSIEKIHWLSPLKARNYRELESEELPYITQEILSFWPANGPVWDAIGIDRDGVLILVEAKAHIKEMESACRAESAESIEKIKRSMREAHDFLSPIHAYPEEVWYNEYYQLANRLTFLAKFQRAGIPLRLVLINFVNDSTHIPTTSAEFQAHYKMVFEKMLGYNTAPEGVVVVDIDVG